jgi:hypothetical protein
VKLLYCIQVDLVHERDITINTISPSQSPFKPSKDKEEEEITQSMSSQMIFAKYSFKSNTWDARKDRSGR